MKIAVYILIILAMCSGLAVAETIGSNSNSLVSEVQHTPAAFEIQNDESGGNSWEFALLMAVFISFPIVILIGILLLVKGISTEPGIKYPTPPNP